jgi:hypothetical protein
MRPWVRSHHANQLTGLYYICVKGELSSTYSMRLKEFYLNRSAPVEIQDGFSESFFSPGQGMQLYLYRVPKLEYSEEDIKLEFMMTM